MDIIKHSQNPLVLSGEYFDFAQKIIDKLHTIPRTGYLDRGVKNPETVGLHTDESIELSNKYFCIKGLTTMLKIHDWPETNDEIGDRRTDLLCSKNTRWTKEQKYLAEFETMKNICSKLGSEGVFYFRLWLEFEENQTIRARVARQTERTQCILKAIKYQKEGEPVIAQEFIDSYRPHIKHIHLVRDIKEALIGL